MLIRCLPPAAQVSGWYTRMLRDEVLAEWLLPRPGSAAAAAELHIHVHVSGRELWLAPPSLRCDRRLDRIVLSGRRLEPHPTCRNYIFRREMSLVLDAFRFADRGFLSLHRSLALAPVFVHFHSDVPEFDRVEIWGQLDNPSTWPPEAPPSFSPSRLVTQPQQPEEAAGLVAEQQAEVPPEAGALVEAPPPAQAPAAELMAAVVVASKAASSGGGGGPSSSAAPFVSGLRKDLLGPPFTRP